jgi:hypothetical protein
MLSYGIIVKTGKALPLLAKSNNLSLEKYLLTLFDPKLSEDEMEEFNENPLEYYKENSKEQIYRENNFIIHFINE